MPQANLQLSKADLIFSVMLIKVSLVEWCLQKKPIWRGYKQRDVSGNWINLEYINFSKILSILDSQEVER